MELKLELEQIEKISNMEFKKEGLGALEFDLKVTNAEFEEKDVHFRIERVSPQTFLKIGGKEKLEQMVPETFKNFIALPVEARDIEFFSYDGDAMSILGQIASKFQQTPLLFSGGIETLKGLLSK